MNRILKNFTLVLALGSFTGCAAFQPMPLTDGPCRDPSTGRYISCGGGGGSGGGTGPSTGTWVALSLLGVGAAIGLLVWAVSSSDSSASSNTQLPTSAGFRLCLDDSGPVTITGTDTCRQHGYRDHSFLAPSAPRESCTLPVESVQVCRSSRGYLFAIPAPGTCAVGSSPLRVQRLSCSDLNRPAYHTCLDAMGEWFATPSWEVCSLMGRMDAPGDFLPPGRNPEINDRMRPVAPRIW